eukprot:15014874-Alexandrium_andersonii.AAC.1
MGEGRPHSQRLTGDPSGPPPNGCCFYAATWGAAKRRLKSLCQSALTHGTCAAWLEVVEGSPVSLDGQVR